MPMQSLPQKLYTKNNPFMIQKSICSALNNNEFHLMMQPIIELKVKGKCVEGECLVRWNSPLLGTVSPELFITIAEKSGLIIPLGNWIIENACRELASFIARGGDSEFNLHINISPVQLQQYDFAKELLDNIKKFGLKGCNICVEITEKTMIQKVEVVLINLNLLREEGVIISLDDFGSGYSGLSYLHTFPFDQLKLDRLFISDLLINPRSNSIVTSIISLSESLKIPLVAEGVEDKQTGDRLRDIGCKLAQGYYFGCPKLFNDWKV